MNHSNGATGLVDRYGFVEVVGRAQASSKIEIRARRGAAEFRLLGTATALPPVDPFLQSKAAPDGTSSFAFRTNIDPGAYVFEVRLQSSSPETASNLSLTDLVSGQKYSFEAGGGRGRFVTPDQVTVIASSRGS